MGPLPPDEVHVTVLGVKMADGRLVQQEKTGKTMNQSSDMYTPIVAGFADEAARMPYFHLCVYAGVDANSCYGVRYRV
jgi:hypothetical protein